MLVRQREAIKRGGDFDQWDLEVRGGLLGYVRALGMAEEHGAGKQQLSSQGLAPLSSTRNLRDRGSGARGNVRCL